MSPSPSHTSDLPPDSEGAALALPDACLQHLALIIERSITPDPEECELCRLIGEAVAE